MRNVRFAVACAAVMLVAAVTQAGTFTDIGPPIPGNSWSQAWTESGAGPFDFMAAHMISGNTLETPGFGGLSGGWVGNPNASPLAATATGTTTTSIGFTTQFNGVSSTPLTMDLYAFLGSTMVDSIRASWSGSSWSFASSAPVLARTDLVALAAVPTPAAASMGLTLMSVMGGLTYLRKRKIA